jgi:hemerythrin-like domain-containing protein
MDVLGTLLEEHRIIGMAIKLLDDSTKKLQSGKKVSPEIFEKDLDILRNFADRCHHRKEEDVLFPLIKEHGTEEARNVSLLLREHEKGRGLVRAMSEAVSKNDSTGMIKNANGYIALMFQHIRKENVLFPPWINPLSDETKKELLERFEEIEAKAIGLGKHQEYLQTIEKLRNELLV